MSNIDTETDKCIVILNAILTSKPDMLLSSSTHTGSATDANALLKFLNLRFENNQKLVKLQNKIREVYKIINPE